MYLQKALCFFRNRAFQTYKKPQQFNAFSTMKSAIPEKMQKQMKEREISEKLRNELKASFVEVIDTSNSGCGQMYKIAIESPLFLNQTKVQQHRMVNEVLKEELKTIHGMNLKTSLPREQEKS